MADSVVLMSETVNLRGMATISFWAADHAGAKKWYTEILGIEPYFNRPGYCEFRLGDFQQELGIIDAAYAPPGATENPGGAVLYWHVDDLAETVQTLIAKGAKEFQPITAHGDSGFVTASVVDPFGNVLGVMTNPHYLEMLRA